MEADDQPTHEEFRKAGMTINALQYPLSEKAFEYMRVTWWGGVPADLIPRTWRFAPNRAVQEQLQRYADEGRQR